MAKAQATVNERRPATVKHILSVQHQSMATTEPAMNQHETKDSVKLTSVTELQISTNPARLKFISLFCAVVYCWEDENAASKLIADCLEVCGGSQQLLSKVLQTRFIDDRTPLRWIICNIGQHQVKELPPLPKALLDHCGPSLSEEAVEDIQKACCDRNDNTMLRAAFVHPLLRDDLLHGFEQPVADVLSGTEVSFRIPNFLDRMLMFKECSVDVVFHRSLYRLLISIDGTWKAQCFPVVACPNDRPCQASLWLAKHDAAGTPGAMEPVSTSSSVSSVFVFSVDFLRSRNSFIGKNRQITGKLDMHR
ncbi:hypothetical protein FA13DRAFT_792915 [Coprinellus micaceus]|uniref:Uncharacterized protein n=1 Tax=Coprinellus micaceus TaxID=71717 RepID=A0A4Y7T2T6_COPMI|nr:hypothetical protein FA13DRAFT_792915 [Coprinellus micaceus]